ncbi:MAG TPA: hypothetical protein VFD32_04295 [Dehalococcoidia bacterium]|nr:hypothetical protein [Dehalococcoidia bacterium]
MSFSWSRLFGVAVLIGSLALLASCSNKNNSSSTARPTATINTLSGVSTVVDLNPDTAKVLADNHVTVAPVGPATAAPSGGTTAVTFPITGGHVAIYPQNDLPFIRGSVTHSGGLTFSAGEKSLTATNLIVDPGASTLTATVGGQQVQLLDLDGHDVKVTKDTQGLVHLDGTVAQLSSAAANALNQTFGVSIFKQGIPIGVVHITATGT